MADVNQYDMITPSSIKKKREGVHPPSSGTPTKKAKRDSGTGAVAERLDNFRLGNPIPFKLSAKSSLKQPQRSVDESQRDVDGDYSSEHSSDFSDSQAGFQDIDKEREIYHSEQDRVKEPTTLFSRPRRLTVFWTSSLQLAAFTHLPQSKRPPRASTPRLNVGIFGKDAPKQVPSLVVPAETLRRGLPLGPARGRRNMTPAKRARLSR